MPRDDACHGVERALVRIRLSRGCLTLAMSEVILKTEDLRVEYRSRELGHEVKRALKGRTPGIGRSSQRSWAKGAGSTSAKS